MHPEEIQIVRSVELSVVHHENISLIMNYR